MFVAVLTIALGATAGAVMSQMRPENLGLTFPILLDPDSKTAGAWRVTGIPTTFVVRPGGEVVGMAVGPRDWNGPEMRRLIETLLSDAHPHGPRR